jgi:hypothetical protein
MNRRFATKCLSWYLVAALFVIGIAPRLEAGFCPSEIISPSTSERTSDLERIQKILEIKMVNKRFSELGLSTEEIQARLSQLNDHQIHELALKLDEIKVGGDGFEVLVVILLIGILVAVWFMVTGKRVAIQ